jgi:hypothetical protein
MSVDICSICTEPLVAPGTKVSTLVCRHTFHYKCIRQYIIDKSCCQVCKIPMEMATHKVKFRMFAHFDSGYEITPNMVCGDYSVKNFINRKLCEFFKVTNVNLETFEVTLGKNRLKSLVKEGRNFFDMRRDEVTYYYGAVDIIMVVDRSKIF